MLTDDDKRMLTELLGECWHDPEIFTCDDNSKFIRCKKCKVPDRTKTTLRTFTTWQDMGDLKKKIVEMGEWHGFWMYAATEFKEVQHKAGKIVWRKSEMSNWLMNPIRFPELVVGWIKEGGKG